MTYRDSLTKVRDQIVAQLIEMTESPKPDYGVGGQSVSWGSHFNNLLRALEELDVRIQKTQPFMQFSKARP